MAFASIVILGALALVEALSWLLRDDGERKK